MPKKIEVDTLRGNALAWFAIVAMKRQPQISCDQVCYRTDHGSWDYPGITEDEAVELMKEHWIGVERPSRGQTPPQWRALADYVGPRDGGVIDLVVSSNSPDLALAVYRAFVKSRLGQSVVIPKELAACMAKEQADESDEIEVD